MAAEALRLPSLAGRSSAEARAQLQTSLEPGQKQLIASGTLSALATAALAAEFFAVAAVAQDVITGATGWPRDGRWLILLACAAVARAVAGYLSARSAAGGAAAVERHLRSGLLRRLISPAGSPPPGAVQATAVLDEVERIGAFAERYEPARYAALLVPCVLLAVVFPLSWPVGVLLVLCAPLPPLNLSVIGMGTAAVARRHTEELRHLSGYFLDRLRGLPTLRALGADRAELARVRVASERLSARAMAVLRVAFISAAALEAIVTVAVALVAIYVGLTLLGYMRVPGLPEHMSLRTGLFVLMVTPLYFQPVRTLAGAYHERAGALAAAEALAPLLSAEPASPGRQTRRSLRAAPAIDVSDLAVAFPHRDRPALDGVTFMIRPGELIGITGPSGAGKSTLLRVLSGDLEPTAGSVRIDGTPPTEIARREITWLGQRPYLFSGTIASNIAVARPDAADLEVGAAARAAGLGPVLTRLPRGLETILGEDGWGISGGEAHRIALARTVLAHSRLLLLDEPTAHLDAQSESTIIAVLRRLTRHTTAVVASHSPAVLDACDRVLVLDRGRLAGPPVGQPVRRAA